MLDLCPFWIGLRKTILDDLCVLWLQGVDSSWSLLFHGLEVILVVWMWKVLGRGLDGFSKLSLPFVKSVLSCESFFWSHLIDEELTIDISLKFSICDWSVEDVSDQFVDLGSFTLVKMLCVQFHLPEIFRELLSNFDILSGFFVSLFNLFICYIPITLILGRLSWFLFYIHQCVSELAQCRWDTSKLSWLDLKFRML